MPGRNENQLPDPLSSSFSASRCAWARALGLAAASTFRVAHPEPERPVVTSRPSRRSVALFGSQLLQPGVLAPRFSPSAETRRVAQTPQIDPLFGNWSASCHPRSLPRAATVCGVPGSCEQATPRRGFSSTTRGGTSEDVSVSLLNNVLPFVTARGEPGNDVEQRDEIIRLLLDSTGEGIYGTDMDGLCTFANPACVRLLGYENELDLLGKNMHLLVHHTRPNGEPYPMSECQIYRAFREQVGIHVDDEVMFCADGTSFPAEYWSYPVVRDGELVGCVLTFTDIRERRTAEQELQQQHEMVRLLLDSTGEGIYGIDLEGNCTFANPACVELLGFDSEADLLGKQMHQLVHHTRPDGEPYPVQECRIYKAFWDHSGVHVDRRSYVSQGWDKLRGRVLVLPDRKRRRTPRLRPHLCRHLRTPRDRACPP